MHRVLGRAIVVIAIVAAVPAFAGEILVTTCGQRVEGRGTLLNDLDCTGSLFGVEVLGRLDLNGHTIIGAANRVAVHCVGKCKIVGPGTITGADGLGVVGRGSFVIKDVTITGTAKALTALTSQGKGHALIERCTITDNLEGIESEVSTSLKDTTVTASGRSGLFVGRFMDPSGNGSCDRWPRVRLLRSSVTGSGTHPDCGIVLNCPDVYVCERLPKMVKSTCGTSCLGATGLPCTKAGICAGGL